MSRFFLGAFTCLFLLWAGCSTSSTQWYKDGAGQADFNIDDAECQIIAEQMAKEATLTGKKISIEEYARVYESCIYNRGWSTEPPASIDAKGPKKELKPIAILAETHITVFDHALELPQGFSLTENRISMWQGVKTQFMTFQNEGGISMSLIFQNNTHRKFEKTDFPVNAPFFIYDKGGEPKEGKKIRWTVFSGEIQKEWIAGIGGFYLLDSKKRITIVLTAPISSPQEVPPEGLKLTKIQKNEVDDFQADWIESIRTAFGACVKCRKKSWSFF